MSDAARAKNADEPWFWYGTLALCVFNTGIALFGEGVKNAVLLELKKNPLESRGDKSSNPF